LAVGEEPRPQEGVFDPLGEHLSASRHGRTTPARPARLWSVLAVYGQAVAFFTFGVFSSAAAHQERHRRQQERHRVISWQISCNKTLFYVFLDQKRDFFLRFSEKIRK
jgi:hypothetical protein